MNDTGAKQQIVDKIKDSSNILVTVSKNPSVDELSAALGLTILLNKMKKHATAVFSGAIPPAIAFLDPEKTFEGTVDSLRDFIIALDKEKADHLRYKVEGDVVKIFITPYRTTITNEDLEFSQGDYNVEMVLGLGVQAQDDLDQALAAHGRILHDAMVATVTVGDMKSELGSIDWHEQNVSSLSELLVGIGESLKSDKPLLDEQIATAFLTGIVAATDRFSNNRTTSKAMTIAAQLMSAGANQQLIASKLEEAHEIGGGAASNADGTTELTEGEPSKVAKAAPKKGQEKTKQNDGALTISHEKQGTVEEVAEATKAENQKAAAAAAQAELAKQTEAVPKAQQSAAAEMAQEKLAEQLASVAPAAAATPSVADLQKDLASASAEVNQAAQTSVPMSGAVTTDQWQAGNQQPAMGGTLNATTEQAADDKRRALEEDRNKTILTHGGTGGYIATNAAPSFQSPLNAATQSEYESPIADPFSQAAQPAPTDTTPTSYVASVQPPAPSETLADLDAKNRTPHDEARAAIDAAFTALPEPQPVVAPVPDIAASLGAPNLAPEPLGAPFQQQPTQDQPVMQPQPAFDQNPAPNLPPLPPMPDFSTLPPLPPGLEVPAAQPSGALPPEKLEEVLGSAPPPTPQPNDPGQFRIPGQG
jgi:hypothetical protein